MAAKVTKPDEFCPRERGGRACASLMGCISLAMLLIKTGALFIYFGALSLLGPLGPIFKERVLLLAWVGCVMIATLSCLAFVGVALHFLGVPFRRWFLKPTLIALSVLGIIALPIERGQHNRCEIRGF